jgi:type IV pilus assembly protein PilO
VRLLPQNQRDQVMVLVGVLGVVALVAYWAYYFDPRSVELDALEERVETLVSRNDRAKLELARGDPERLRQEALTVRQNLDMMRQLVPTSNEVPALLEQVSTAARRVGLDLSGVQPEPVVPGDQFDTYRYKISVVGDYHALGAFMANVGSLTRIVAPMNVQLRPQAAANAGTGAPARGNTSQLLDSEFQIQTYVARASTPVPAPQVEDSPR